MEMREKQVEETSAMKKAVIEGKELRAMMTRTKRKTKATPTHRSFQEIRGVRRGAHEEMSREENSMGEVSEYALSILRKLRRAKEESEEAMSARGDDSCMNVSIFESARSRKDKIEHLLQSAS